MGSRVGGVWVYRGLEEGGQRGPIGFHGKGREDERQF